ncbi:venom serine protease Bi-VSP-like [Cochliomyia hominivorax]
MKLFISLALIVVACVTSPVTAQRWVRQQQQQQAQYCVTPENYYGSCVTLSFCPQIANVFQTTNQRQAQQYVILSQRACGTRNINGDPVVCCTRPLTTPQTTSSPQRQTRRPQVQQTTPSFVFPNTQTPRNPFLIGTTNPAIVPPPTQAPIVTQRPTVATSTNGNLVENKAGYCRGPDLREGSCTPIKECQPLVNELLEKQTDPTFANFLKASNRICGNVNTNVCCPSSTPTVTTKAPVIRNTNEIPRRLPTVEEGCGYSNNSYKKIVGGEVSKKGAWPWVALLGYDDELSANPFKCGGALVSARHVVTAAHCLRRDLTFVRLGEHDLTTNTEARHVDIKIARMEKHPDYNPRNGHSDIAVLYLERNVQFTDSISPICMPTSPQLRQRSYVRYTPFVVGWGKTMEGGISANVLQELQIPIYDNQVCRDRYKQQNRLFTENQFDSAVLCAGVLSGGKDTCQGDSGGPLMIPEPYGNGVRFYLIGVVSYGIGCARPEIPGVYSSTQYFIDWIIQKVADTP